VKEHQYFVYIMSSRSGTLYIGITNSIYRRALQHKRGEIEGFASKYGCNRLVYYEGFDECAQSDRQGKAAEGLDPSQENCLDRVEKSPLGRSSRKVGSADVVCRRIDERQVKLSS